jgi:hypothetical protein
MESFGWDLEVHEPLGTWEEALSVRAEGASFLFGQK